MSGADKKLAQVEVLLFAEEKGKGNEAGLLRIGANLFLLFAFGL